MENSKGFFGNFGGAFVNAKMKAELENIEKAYNKIKNDPEFLRQMDYIRRTYQGRPTPISYAKNLTDKIGGAKIYLKREDLNHTGAHKINHCIGEVLLAKFMGKKKVIGETGAGQHGVALATAAAYLGLKCEIHMGSRDIEKERPNVQRMKLLGCDIVEVKHGQQSLKEAVDSALATYEENMEDSLYCIGSVVGPHPFPSLIRDYQSIIGNEAKEQMTLETGKLPAAVVACVGGGSNAIGVFGSFLNDDVELYGVEPLGKGTKLGDHAASIAFGKEAILHGFRSLVISDDEGKPADVYSIASGLDYPSVGPEHAYLHTIKRVKYVQIDDKECLDAFYLLPKMEGIIPALESAHAVAYAIKLAEKMSAKENILVNLSGRGDKDIDFVINTYGL